MEIFDDNKNPLAANIPPEVPTGYLRLLLWFLTQLLNGPIALIITIASLFGLLGWSNVVIDQIVSFHPKTIIGEYPGVFKFALFLLQLGVAIITILVYGLYQLFREIEKQKFKYTISTRNLLDVADQRVGVITDQNSDLKNRLAAIQKRVDRAEEEGAYEASFRVWGFGAERFKVIHVVDPATKKSTCDNEIEFVAMQPLSHWSRYTTSDISPPQKSHAVTLNGSSQRVVYSYEESNGELIELFEFNPPITKNDGVCVLRFKNDNQEGSYCTHHGDKVDNDGPRSHERFIQTISFPIKKLEIEVVFRDTEQDIQRASLEVWYGRGDVPLEHEKISARSYLRQDRDKEQSRDYHIYFELEYPILGAKYCVKWPLLPTEQADTIAEQNGALPDVDSD